MHKGNSIFSFLDPPPGQTDVHESYTWFAFKYQQTLKDYTVSGSDVCSARVEVKYANKYVLDFTAL